jgi:hypothetical protein
MSSRAADPVDRYKQLDYQGVIARPYVPGISIRGDVALSVSVCVSTAVAFARPHDPFTRCRDALAPCRLTAFIVSSSVCALKNTRAMSQQSPARSNPYHELLTATLCASPHTHAGRTTCDMTSSEKVIGVTVSRASRALHWRAQSRGRLCLRAVVPVGSSPTRGVR